MKKNTSNLPWANHSCFALLDHLKVLQCIPNSLFLFGQALGLLVALRLGLVVALPLDDPAFLLDLGDVEGSDVQAGLLLDVVLDFLIGSLGLCRSGVHLVQVKAELDMIVWVLLG